MLQRSSSQPCYYVRLSPLLLVMRTGSQRKINLSEDLFTGSRPRYMYILQNDNGMISYLFCKFRETKMGNASRD